MRFGEWKLPIEFENTPCETYRPAQPVGADNAEVLGDWLGMSAAEVKVIVLRYCWSDIREKARTLFQEKFYDVNRYRLGRVGRFRINRKLELNVSEKEMTLRPEDLIASINYLLELAVSGGRSVNRVLHPRRSVGWARYSNGPDEFRQRRHRCCDPLVAWPPR